MSQLISSPPPARSLSQHRQESIRTFLDWLTSPEEAIASDELVGAMRIISATPEKKTVEQVLADMDAA